MRNSRFVVASLRRGLGPWFWTVSVALLAGGGCRCDRDSEGRQVTARSSPSSVAAPAPVASGLARLPEPTTWLTLDHSAFNATLKADGDGVVLLTNTRIYRVEPGHALQMFAVELGDVRGVMRDQVVFWSKGALRRVQKGSGEAEVIIELLHRPQRMVTSAGAFAWLEQDKGRSFAIHTLHQGHKRELVASSGQVPVMAMDETHVYFVEELRGQGWRLASVGLGDGRVRRGELKKVRTPADLLASSGVAYYDGPSLTVRQLSPELVEQKVLARETICSPMALGDKLFCSQPPGLLELELDGKVRRTLPLSNRGAITALTLTSKQLFMLVDAGREKLALKSLPL